jgi:hypothetical protein
MDWMKIFNWNMIYDLVFVSYRSSVSFVMLDLLLTELCPLTEDKYQFSEVFSALDGDIQLEFNVCLCLGWLQIKFEFLMLDERLKDYSRHLP